MVRRSQSEPDGERSRRNGYAHLELLRLGDAADDPALWQAALKHPQARAIVLDEEARCLCTEAGLLRIALSSVASEELILLGFEPGDRAPLFLANGRGGEGDRWQDLRSASALLPAAEVSLFAFARALHLWHRSHRYCPTCGAATTPDRAGHARRCTNPRCGRRHFPRVDPCIIVLPSRAGRCLLVRQPHWPPRRYSAIAGFVEPGETLEQAVRREIREEIGLEAAAVHYHSSQPWPFPGSLMIAFQAELLPGEAKASAEIAEFGWWSAADLLAALDAGEIAIAPPWSVAHRLIRDFVEASGLMWPEGSQPHALG